MNEFIARWYANDLQIEDKREEFYRALLARLDADPMITRLFVDYDPNLPLVYALRDIGIECRGFLYSAKGIFSYKTLARKDNGKWTVRRNGQEPEQDNQIGDDDSRSNCTLSKNCTAGTDIRSGT